jgi:Cof subfamily protein (haloacid dehalogenase superfamily)
MNYRMIVSDVDGTLFESGNKIDSDIVRLVDQYQGMGGIFTLATGRMKRAVDPFIKELHITCPLILYNGAQVVDPVTNDILVSHHLKNDLAYAALKLLSQFTLDTIMHVNQEPYVQSYSPAILAHMEKDGIECKQQDDLFRLLKDPPTKLLVIGDPVQLALFADELKRRVNDDFQPVYSARHYLEILPPNASKGKALLKLAQLKGIPISSVIAVGDERNDMTMIQAAGLGVAVANANRDVKQIADRITAGFYHHGLAEILREAINS